MNLTGDRQKALTGSVQKGYEETTILYLNNDTSVMTNPDYQFDEGDRAGLEAFEEYRRRCIIRAIMNSYKR